MGIKNKRSNGKSWAISDRSGFKFPMSEMVQDDDYLVHKSETDGNWSLKQHPLSNMGRYLRGKTGDPFPVPNARPDRNWHEPRVYEGKGRTGGASDSWAYPGAVRLGSSTSVGSGIASAFASRTLQASGSDTGVGTASAFAGKTKYAQGVSSGVGEGSSIGFGNYKGAGLALGTGFAHATQGFIIDWDMNDWDMNDWDTA